MSPLFRYGPLPTQSRPGSRRLGRRWVRNTVSKIARKLRRKRIRGKRRKVGFYNSIGCRGHRRTIRATFIDERGRKVTATKARHC
jgi:hypothetical protein